MSALRRVLLTALPKVALSRLCGLVCSLPLPKSLRPKLFGWFARRYGASLDQVAGELTDYRSMQDFFRRPLRPGARPLATTALAWPCDGRIVTSSPIVDGRIPQVKGNDYDLADLLGSAALAAELDGGWQATIYLAPGDYHRVHAPFDAEIESVTALPGTLFPVNPKAVACIPRLFARNSRHVFRCRLPGGTPAAVVMVGAYNVGDTTITRSGGAVLKGDELGRFGFGSTVVALIGRGPLRFAPLDSEARVWMGGSAMASDDRAAG